MKRIIQNHEIEQLMEKPAIMQIKFATLKAIEESAEEAEASAREAEETERQQLKKDVLQAKNRRTLMEALAKMDPKSRINLAKQQYEPCPDNDKDRGWVLVIQHGRIDELDGFYKKKTPDEQY